MTINMLYMYKHNNNNNNNNNNSKQNEERKKHVATILNLGICTNF